VREPVRIHDEPDRLQPPGGEVGPERFHPRPVRADPRDETASAPVTAGHRAVAHLVFEAMDTATQLAPFTRRRTALLTTFKRDGTPVDTPVTIAVEGDHAFMRTYDRAGKAKRLRNDPSARIAPSTIRGRPRGAGLAARVTLLDGAEAEHAARAIARRQPILQGVLVPLFHRMKRYRTLHYRVTPAAPGRGGD
jgi:uncharacterized protein